MSRSKKLGCERRPVREFSVHPRLFVFFDKCTGTPRFQIQARQDGTLPTEQAIGLLAVQCIARQKTPRDFGVMVATNEDLIGSLVGRTMKVIEGSGNGRSSAPLSRRQDQVLEGITQNLTNKEIAAKLNISERTVKFHVSSLLQRFEVRGRVDLMLEVTNALPHESVHCRHPKVPGIPAAMAPSAAPVNERGRPRILATTGNSVH